MADNDNQHDRSETPQPEGPAPQQGEEHGSARDEARDSSAEQSAATPGDDAAAKPGAQADEQPAERAESHTDDGAETPDDNETPQSRGLGIRLRELSGPQACLSIVGCGTLAAVLVVGLVFGGIRLVAGSLFGSGDDGDDIAAESPERTPRESMDPGVLDVCTIGIESSGRFSNLVRTDERSDPVDTATQGAGADDLREVYDSCSWEVAAETSGSWEFDLDYRAVVAVPEDEEKAQVAQADFEDRLNDVRQDFDQIIEEGSLENRDVGELYSFYGSPVGGARGHQYALVGRDRGATFTVVLADTESSLYGSDGANESDFRALGEAIVREVHLDFEYHLPD